MTLGDPLEGLHDIVLPEPASYLPQTVGWVALLLVAIGLAVGLGVRLHRRSVRRRYRELALKELEALDRRLGEGDRESVCGELPELVKRTALVAYPRVEVASLVGDEWLEFLDQSVGDRAFSDGPGRRLPELAYSARPEDGAPAAEELQALVSVVRKWILEHRPPAIDSSAARGGG